MPQRVYGCLIYSGRCLFGTIIALLLLPGPCKGQGETVARGQALKSCLQTTQILNLAEYLDSTVGAPDSYAQVAKRPLILRRVTRYTPGHSRRTGHLFMR